MFLCPPELNLNIIFEKSDHSVDWRFLNQTLSRVILAYGFFWHCILDDFVSFGLFLRLVKSRLKLEAKAGDTRKWIPFADGIQIAISSPLDRQNNRQ